MFTSRERAYLADQVLGRLATVDARGRPHVVPVGYHHDPETDTILVGGRRFGASRKYRDARDRRHVALVVDDLASTDPWRPRGIEVRGLAEAVTRSGRPPERPDDAMIRITPTRIVAWGIDTDPFGPPRARDVDPEPSGPG
ncbi:MAG TPA: PPOX class F420-dependent oxidoreductase [Acidimicrobiales bacterium]